MDNIVAALIAAGSSIFVGILTLAGVVITNSKTNKELQHKLEISQAVTDTKIETLTTEVREHNNFAKRIPLVEQEIKDLKNDVATLKKYHMQKN